MRIPKQKRVRRGAKKHHKAVSVPKVSMGRVVSVLNRLVLVVVLGSIITASVWGMNWLMRPDTFPIKQVEFRSSAKHFNVAGFEQKLLNEMRGGFFSLQIGALKAFIESEAWVYEVDLRRRWPDGLIVEVEEQLPIARWGEAQLLNRYAEVFLVPDSEMPGNLPSIAGVEGRQKTLVEDFIRYDELLAGIGQALVSLHEDRRHNQKLMLANGTELILGREHHDHRIMQFVEVYPITLKDVMPSVAILDLRYGNGFSVGWRDQPEPVEKLAMNTNQ